MIEFLSTYSYMTGTLFLLLLWVFFLGISWKNHRSEFAAMSILGALGSIPGTFMYDYDWWAPLRVYEFVTPLGIFGIEDILFGLTVSGLSVGVAHFVTSLFLRRTHQKEMVSLVVIFCLFGIMVAGMVAITFIFNVHSFYATTLVSALMATAMLLHHRSLLLLYVNAGVGMVLVSIPTYALTLYFNPTWIATEWQLDNFSGPMLWGIPIEEFVWFFTVGGLIGILWSYTAKITRKA